MLPGKQCGGKQKEITRWQEDNMEPSPQRIVNLRLNSEENFRLVKKANEKKPKGGRQTKDYDSGLQEMGLTR